MKYKNYILPTGIILALIISLVYPQAGIILKQLRGVEISVIVIFLIYGYTHNFREFNYGYGFIKNLLIVLITSLIIAPFIGLVTANLLLYPAAGLGLIVMSSMPPTLSSGVVITETAKGNTILALSLTIALNLIALFSVPATLSLILSSTNAIEISPVDLFIKLLILVFIPFIMGTLIRKSTPKLSSNNYLRLIPIFCIILAIWICMSISSSTLKEINLQTLILIVISVLFVHTILLIINYILGSYIKADLPDKKAIMFLGSQKTLPLAAFILTILPQINATALIVCIIFHFCQLLLDSIIASIMSSTLNQKDLQYKI